MPQQFGPYRLVRKIAQGGMAEVFLAERSGAIGGFKKLVAIKRIYPHLAESPELISMFFDEARIAAQLNHPNIVQIYDLGQAKGYYFIAMEYVAGRDLRSVCERGLRASNFLPLPMAVRIAAEAASGLHFAHTRRDARGKPLSIVHRDISPQNVLISMTGNVKVCDFGIAKAEQRLTQTRTGQFKGKFAYMSPEQVAADPGAIDLRSDIFSLGIVLYETTVCTRLFRGQNDYDTIRLVTESSIPDPSEIRPGFPRDLERIIMRALARPKGERYESAQQMQMALEEWLVEHRAKTSPVHIARYMDTIFPELLERNAPDSERTAEHDFSELTRAPSANAPRPDDDFDAEATALSTLSPQQAAHLDATTGEVDVERMRRELSGDRHDAPEPVPGSDAPPGAGHDGYASALDVQPTMPSLPPAGAELSPAHRSGRTAFAELPVAARPHEARPPSPGGLRAQRTSSRPADMHTLVPSRRPSTGTGGTTMRYAIAALRRGARRRKISAAIAILALGALAAIGYLARASLFGSARSERGAMVDAQPEERAALARRSIMVRTDPQGARVVVNGALTASKTPTAVDVLAESESELLIVKRGWVPRFVRVPALGEAPDTIRLRRAEQGGERASIEIASKPLGAEVYVDGAYAGEAPLVSEPLLAPGPHHVLVRRQGYRDQVLIADLKPGESYRFDAPLTPFKNDQSAPGLVGLGVESIPDGASVTLQDGSEPGVAKLYRSLPTHARVAPRLSGKGYEEIERIVETRELSGITLRAALKKIRSATGRVELKVPASAENVYIGARAYTRAELARLDLRSGPHPIVIEDKRGRRYEATLEVKGGKTRRLEASFRGEALRLRERSRR